MFHLECESYIGIDNDNGFKSNKEVQLNLEKQF